MSACVLGFTCYTEVVRLEVGAPAADASRAPRTLARVCGARSSGRSRYPRGRADRVVIAFTTSPPRCNCLDPTLEISSTVRGDCHSSARPKANEIERCVRLLVVTSACGVADDYEFGWVKNGTRRYSTAEARAACSVETTVDDDLMSAFPVPILESDALAKVEIAARKVARLSSRPPWRESTRGTGSPRSLAYERSHAAHRAVVDDVA